MVKIDLDGARATITIDDPERRNPITAATVADLIRLTVEANSHPEVRVFVYTGAGDQAFSAGGDLSSGFFDDPIGLHRERGRLAELFRTMWEGEKPTVARVNGHALAGGFGLAVACDITVCVEDARLGTPEIGVGLWPMMITVPLLRAISPKTLFELMATGRVLTPDEALRLGAVSRVVTRSNLDAAVDEVVASLARHSPATLALGRRAFGAVGGMSPLAALDFLHAGLTSLTLTDDAREGLLAFSEKRDPTWTAR
jgi:enoyl-CoA hydratase/carnithine racemase